MSNPTFPIHPHPHGLMSNRNQRRLRRQQAGVTASQGGPVFVSPEDQFRMSLDISDGRHVLHFRPSRWDRWSQQLEVTVGELLQDQPVPLLKRRLELSREEGIKLWGEKRKAGWAPCSPQW